MNTYRRAVLAAAFAAPLLAPQTRAAGNDPQNRALASVAEPKFTLEHLYQSYSQLKEFIYLYNEQTGIPPDRAEEYLYKRLLQVQATVDLGLR